MQSPKCRLIEYALPSNGELAIIFDISPTIVSVITSVIIIIIFRLKQSVLLAVIYTLKHPSLLVELQRTESDKTNTLFTLKAPLI